MNTFVKSFLFNILVVSLILTSLADAVLSYMWITEPAWGEANPIVRFLWTTWGYTAVAVWKFLFTAISLSCIYYIKNKGYINKALFALFVCNGIMFIVIAMLLEFGRITCQL